ncbi:MAG: TauD/TfdA family dioxygenase [Microbacterium sp.]
MQKIQTAGEYQHIVVKPVAGYVGAEVSGVDLTKLNDEVAEELRRAFGDHSALMFRDQTLTPDDLEKFGNIFGTHLIRDGAPAVTPFVREADHVAGERAAGDLWHQDFTYYEQPTYAAALYSVDVPPYGGDTMFASNQAAFAALSPALQTICEQLTVMHSASGLYGADGQGGKGAQKPLDYYGDNAKIKDTLRAVLAQETPHPLVISHPVTKRKALLISGLMAVRFDGMTIDESQPLLQYLYQHVQRPEFTTRWRWEPNQLVIWDNLACLHFAVQDYSGMRRQMYRFELEGFPLEPANPAAIITA